MCLPLFEHFIVILVHTYLIEVRTGDLEGADTTAMVHLQMFGERGDTGVRKLLTSITPPPEDGSPAAFMFSRGKVGIKFMNIYSQSQICVPILCVNIVLNTQKELSNKLCLLFRLLMTSFVLSTDDVFLSWELFLRDLVFYIS